MTVCLRITNLGGPLTAAASTNVAFIAGQALIISCLVKPESTKFQIRKNNVFDVCYWLMGQTNRIRGSNFLTGSKV